MSNFTTYAHKLKSSTDNIYLLHGESDGRAAWYYILLDKMKVPLFQRACELHQFIDIMEYGKILKSGYGKEPAPYIVEKIKREGANYDETEFLEPFQALDMPYYVQGWDADDMLIYNYVIVPAAKINEFLIVMANGGCDVADYGTVVETGWGEPTDELKNQMRLQGFMHPGDQMA